MRLTLADLQGQFGVGLKDAANRLGICPTTLKRACRWVVVLAGAEGACQVFRLHWGQQWWNNFTADQACLGPTPLLCFAAPPCCSCLAPSSCRRHGIQRWPRRQLQKVNRTLDEMEAQRTMQPQQHLAAPLPPGGAGGDPCGCCRRLPACLSA